MGRTAKNVKRLSISLPAYQVDTIRAMAELADRPVSYVIERFLEAPVALAYRMLVKYEEDPSKLSLFRDMILGDRTTEIGEDTESS